MKLERIMIDYKQVFGKISEFLQKCKQSLGASIAKTWKPFFSVLLTLFCVGAVFYGAYYISETDWVNAENALDVENLESEQVAAIISRNRGWFLWATGTFAFAVLGIALTVWGRITSIEQNKKMQEQIELSREANVYERYEKAANMLGGDSPTVRMGGCIALRGLAKYEEEMKDQCVNLLIAFIDEINSKDDGEKNEIEKLDVKEALNVILEIIPNPADISFKNKNLSKMSMAGMKFSGTDFEGVDLSKTNLIGAMLEEANFEGANLKQTFFMKANLQNANLASAVLEKANFLMANLSGANLQEADLRNGKLYGANLQDAKLVLANLDAANLQEANMNNADLKDAILVQANLQSANLTRAKLQNANLQKANLLDADLQDANLTRANLQEANFLIAKLQRADLREANLREANLDNANLSRSDLRGANLQNANLQNANLQETKLSGANLQGANLQQIKFQNVFLREAKLRGVNLQYTDLQNLDFHDLDLQGANFQGSNLAGANFQGADLKGAILMETKLHETEFFGTDISGVNFTYSDGLTREQILSAKWGRLDDGSGGPPILPDELMKDGDIQEWWVIPDYDYREDGEMEEHEDYYNDDDESEE